MSGKKHKLSKQAIYLIVIAVLIVVLIVIICAGIAKTRRKDQISTTSAVPTSVTETTTYKYVDDSGNDVTPHFSKDGKRMMEGDHLGVFEGMAWSTINGKKDLYYFTNATYDPSYTGLADGPDGRYYFARNGKWDRSFTGVVSYGHYMRVCKHGIYQEDYDGDVDLGGFPASCEDGAVLGVELGRDDGFIPPYKVTIED